jgi:hypothetical protein
MTILPPLPGDPYVKKMEPMNNQTIYAEGRETPVINAAVSRLTGLGGFIILVILYNSKNRLFYAILDNTNIVL